MGLEALQEHLPEAQRGRVHGIKATVDLGQGEFAARLLLRLDARAVLMGASWTGRRRLDFTRASQCPRTKLLGLRLAHLGRDAGRMPWRRFSRSRHQRAATDAEFPLELTEDLAALMNGAVAAAGLAETPADSRPR